jgi:Site-specific recombinase XerD
MFPSPVTGDDVSQLQSNCINSHVANCRDPDAVGRIHKKLLARAGLDKGIRFRDLRHTFSAIMIQNGADAKTLSNMLGHYSAAFALDTCTQPNAGIRCRKDGRVF